MPSLEEKFNKILDFFHKPTLPLVFVFASVLIVSSRHTDDSWVNVFVPMYLMDILLLALVCGCKGNTYVLYFVGLVAKIASDIALPLKLDGKIDTPYTQVLIPLFVLCLALLGSLIMSFKKQLRSL
eukprot:m.55718 g.55718  ORF g.55718 m.55718 type:complete len:126 (-) comp11143_c1_seq2:107-484(-)